MATKKREGKGSGCCCCCGLLTTLVVLVALGIGGYIYRDQVLEMIYKISNRDELQTTEEYVYESSVRNIYSTRDYGYGSGDTTGEPEFDSTQEPTTLRKLYEPSSESESMDNEYEYNTVDSSDESEFDSRYHEPTYLQTNKPILSPGFDYTKLFPSLFSVDEYGTTQTTWEEIPRESSTLPPVQNVTQISEGSGSSTTEYIESSTVRKFETDDEYGDGDDDDYGSGSGKGRGIF